MPKQTTPPKNESYDFLVFIGRFQPFHKGHYQVLSKALAQAERVIVLAGSSYQPRSIRNPWTFAEREQYIRASFDTAVQDRLIILPLLDELYNDQNWIKRVQETVHGVVSQYPPKVGISAPKIAVIGHGKDHTSYYLSLFPQWGSVSVDAYKDISATDLREQYFLQGSISEEFPDPVRALLKTFQQQENYQTISEEWKFIQQYKQGWAAAPYPPVFVTVDAVVIKSGHILLVERKARPGKGLWALPGGFVNQYEDLQTAMVRELREETRLKVPAPVLLGSLARSQVFDHPQRSERGRTITHAYLIELKPDAQGLPKVKGGDDAMNAFWLPLAELNPEQLFEDHFHIIKTLVG